MSSIKFTLPGILLVAALVLSGCGSDGDRGQAATIRECKATLPSIGQGVYGCTTSSSDAIQAGPDPQPSLIRNLGVAVYARTEQPPNENGAPPIASTESNEMGFYQLELAPGTYWLCARPFRCTDIGIGAGQLLRRDYESGGAPGGWSEAPDG